MIDNTDKAILQILQEDSRLKLRQIQEKLKHDFNIEVTHSTVGRRIKDMEKEGVIQSYTVTLNPKFFEIAYPICFFIETNPKKDVEAIAKELENFEELIYIHHLAGDFQLACFARCKDTNHAAELSKKISSTDGIQRIVSHSILQTFKEDLSLNLMNGD